MDLKGFKPLINLPRKVDYVLHATIGTGQHNLTANMDCTRFFCDKGYKRVELLVNDDYSYVALVPSEHGTRVKKDVNCTVAAHVVTDRLRGMHPEEEHLSFKGFEEDGVLYFKLV